MSEEIVKIFECDLCHQVIDRYDSDFHHFVVDDYYSVDVCSNCRNKFGDWITSLHHKYFRKRG